jgi:hypothetical protein
MEREREREERPDGRGRKRVYPSKSNPILDQIFIHHPSTTKI